MGDIRTSHPEVKHQTSLSGLQEIKIYHIFVEWIDRIFRGYYYSPAIALSVDKDKLRLNSV